jgi:hypothetical protein
MSEALSRAVGFQREFDRRRAEVAIRSTHGTAYLAPGLPRVYDLNLLLADLGAAVSAAELIAETDEIFGSYGLAHRKVAIDDSPRSQSRKAFVKRAGRSKSSSSCCTRGRRRRSTSPPSRR